MSQHTAVIAWERKGAVFTDGRFSRYHRWIFYGGVEIGASASPLVVPIPFSVEQAVDPEEAFVAALASCHMLWFLVLAASRGFVVDSYRDEARGVMAKNASDKLAMTEVVLRPEVGFATGKQPSDAEHRATHHEAHERCFIASSVKTEVRCEPSIAENSSVARKEKHVTNNVGSERRKS